MEGREEFIALLESDWPVAYAEYRERSRQPVIEPLHRHLLITSALSVELFKDRLGVIEKRIRWERGELVAIMSLAALLHDVAKSSRYYLERFKESGDTKISFWLHELAGAVLLEMARISSTGSAEYEGSIDRALRVIARSIARHHSAMDDRHPGQLIDRVLGDRNSMRYLENILRSIDPGFVDSLRGLIPCRYGSIGGDFCDKVFQRLGDAIESINEDDRLSGKVHDILRSRIIAKAGSHVDELLAVHTVTGFLVIADNIAAHLGRGVSDDGTSPAYVRHWVCELSEKLEEVSSRGCEVLRSIRKDIWRLVMEFSLEGVCCVP